MRKTITLIITGYLLSQGLTAQITITNASSYKVGQSYTIQACDAADLVLSATGANVNVDYSKVNPVGTPQSANFVTPVGTPYANSFPGSNVSFSALTSQSNLAYTYYNSTASKMELLGLATPSIALFYSDPQLLLNFPTNFNDTYTDKSRSVYFTNGVEGRRTVNSTMLADAWGNITTPTGTYPYLRLKTTQVLSDSFFRNGNLLQLSIQTLITYNYFNSNYVAQLFSYTESISAQGTSKSANYYVSGNVSVAENNDLNASLKVYPNPAKDNIVIDLGLNRNDIVAVNVYNVTGKLVLHNDIDQIQRIGNSLNLGIANLDAGLHTIVLETTNGKTKPSKFIIE